MVLILGKFLEFPIPENGEVIKIVENKYFLIFSTNKNSRAYLTISSNKTKNGQGIPETYEGDRGERKAWTFHFFKLEKFEKS